MNSYRHQMCVQWVNWLSNLFVCLCSPREAMVVLTVQVYELKTITTLYHQEKTNDLMSFGCHDLFVLSDNHFERDNARHERSSLHDRLFVTDSMFANVFMTKRSHDFNTIVTGITWYGSKQFLISGECRSVTTSNKTEKKTHNHSQMENNKNK